MDPTTPSAFVKRATDLLIGLPLALISLPVVLVAAMVSAAALRANAAPMPWEPPVMRTCAPSSRVMRRA